MRLVGNGLRTHYKELENRDLVNGEINHPKTFYPWTTWRFHQSLISECRIFERIVPFRLRLLFSEMSYALWIPCFISGSVKLLLDWLTFFNPAYILIIGPNHSICRYYHLRTGFLMEAIMAFIFLSLWLRVEVHIYWVTSLHSAMLGDSERSQNCKILT